MEALSKVNYLRAACDILNNTPVGRVPFVRNVERNALNTIRFLCIRNAL